jgi:hypothetical protein
MPLIKGWGLTTVQPDVARFNNPPEVVIVRVLNLSTNSYPYAILDV